MNSNMNFKYITDSGRGGHAHQRSGPSLALDSIFILCKCCVVRSVCLFGRELSGSMDYNYREGNCSIMYFACLHLSHLVPNYSILK